MDEATIAIVFGKRGSGKTVKATNLVADESRVLFYDTLCHDYTDGVIVDSLEELKAFWRKVYRGSFRIIYRPTDPQGDFPEICRLVYEAGDIYFVVEEVDMFFKGDTTSPEFRQIIQRGRHARVSLVGVTQRPKGFGRLLTSQVHDFYVFRVTEPVDADYFRERLSQDAAGKLAGLGQYQYLHYIDRDASYEIKTDNVC